MHVVAVRGGSGGTAGDGPDARESVRRRVHRRRGQIFIEFGCPAEWVDHSCAGHTTRWWDHRAAVAVVDGGGRGDPDAGGGRVVADDAAEPVVREEVLVRGRRGEQDGAGGRVGAGPPSVVCG